MAMVLTPDLKQNIFYTLYFTISHNAIAMAYAVGIVGSIIYAFLRPSRRSLLFLLGFIILLFSFEYVKHIQDGLREQTLNALITVQEHNKIRRFINLATLKLFPLGLPFLGWSLIGIAGYLTYRHRKKPPKLAKKS